MLETLPSVYSWEKTALKAGFADLIPSCAYLSIRNDNTETYVWQYICQTNPAKLLQNRTYVWRKPKPKCKLLRTFSPRVLVTVYSGRRSGEVFRPRNGGEAYRLGYSWMGRVRLFLRVEPELHLSLS